MNAEKKFYKIARKYTKGKATKDQLFVACAAVCAPREKEFYDKFDSMLECRNFILSEEIVTRNDPEDSPFHSTLIKTYNDCVDTLLYTVRSTFVYICYLNYKPVSITYELLHHTMSIPKIVGKLCEITNLNRSPELVHAFALAMEAVILNGEECFAKQKIFHQDFDLFEDYFAGISYI